MTKSLILVVSSFLVMLIYSVLVRIFPSVYVLEVTDVLDLVLGLTLFPLYLPVMIRIVKDNQCDNVGRLITGMFYLLVGGFVEITWRLVDRMFGSPSWIRDDVLGGALAFISIGYTFWLLAVKDMSLKKFSTFLVLASIGFISLVVGGFAITFTRSLGH